MSIDKRVDKSRLCKFGLKCMSKHNCMRVHSLNEWTPNMCHYDKKCRMNERCKFLHSKETKHDYLTRIIQQKDNNFYFSNQHLYLKHFNISIKK